MRSSSSHGLSLGCRPNSTCKFLVPLNNYVGVTTMKRHDQGHLYPLLEQPETNLSRPEWNPGRLRHRRALWQRAIRTASTNAIRNLYMCTPEPHSTLFRHTLRLCSNKYTVTLPVRHPPAPAPSISWYTHIARHYTWQSFSVTTNLRLGVCLLSKGVDSLWISELQDDGGGVV